MTQWNGWHQMKRSDIHTSETSSSTEGDTVTRNRHCLLNYVFKINWKQAS